jgi:hypothetical protein
LNLVCRVQRPANSYDDGFQGVADRGENVGVTA